MDPQGRHTSYVIRIFCSWSLVILFLIIMQARLKQKEEEAAKAREEQTLAEVKKRQYRENNILAKKFDLLVDALIAL